VQILKNKKVITTLLALLIAYAAGMTYYVVFYNKSIELNAGEYVVGEDLDAGRYKVESIDDKTGNFSVWTDDVPFINELLGESKDATTKSVTVSLKDGQKVLIAHMNGVKLKPKN